MKFAIITHAEHKISKQAIFAYEPYVKEMNLWLKYVDEVKIVAPVSIEKISSIDSNYLVTERSRSALKNKRHCEQSEAISFIEQIATSHTPRNDESAKVEQIPNHVGNDRSVRHCEQSEAISSSEPIAASHTPRNDGIELIKIPSFDITSLKNSIKALFKIPKICYQIYKTMQWADHIHLRCPGNIGLLGCFVQILFPKKPKTVKYAGNWDPNSKQPLTYRIQKWIVSNTFLTKNCKVLVYGNWQNQSSNIVPFFTASYSEKEIEEVKIRSVLGVKKQIPNQHLDYTQCKSGNEESIRHPQLDWGSYESELNDEQLNQVQHNEKARHSPLDAESHDLEQIDEMLNQVEHDEYKEPIATLSTPRNDDGIRLTVTERSRSDNNILKFIYVGGLTPGKQPLLSVQVVHKLYKKGYAVQLNMYGDGIERIKIADYILDNSLEELIFLHGNTSKEMVKKAYQKAHFLLFISKSEGWPKVVAEAMFWGCVPITSKVSCVSEMLGNGSRGTVVKANLTEIIEVIEQYLNSEDKYREHAKKAMDWSRQYTLEKFEGEIGRLL